MAKKLLIIIGIAVAVILISSVFLYVIYFGAPKKNADLERFIVGQNFSFAQTVDKLASDGFIKNKKAFDFVLSLNKIKKINSGGYKISKAMNAFEIASILSGKSYMKWVVIPEGLRKEEIANILAENLGWTKVEKDEWINKDTAVKLDYTEGVYFPDTYLISVDETPEAIAKRLQTHFEEKFSTFSKEASKQNIKWVTVVKLASIIQREAASKDDMPIISGVLWNRLDQGMKLEVDSTLQYARGDVGQGYWAPIRVADKKLDSPYNTYMNKGLPPAPISNPGTDAMKAVLYPAKTKCLYYLHDSSKDIHCAETYPDHQKNIALYLK